MCPIEPMKTKLLTVLCLSQCLVGELTYPIVDTGQVRCYNDSVEIVFPEVSSPFYGQDAHYAGNQPAYQDNKDGTVTDEVTGLMWLSEPGEKMSFDQAVAGASQCRVGGYTDWRLPTIKELYSLILFSGTDPDPRAAETNALKPFIDTRYFHFSYGDPAGGDRIIDSQFATSTLYRSRTMNGNETMFGVNFADGRIKGYPIHMPGNREKIYYVLYVRGNPEYGRNRFVDHGDGTITDEATGLIWMKQDSGYLKAGKDGRLNWAEALEWAENLEYAGRSDWRLPNAKELQSIVDYNRCPDVTDSAAIDPIFAVTAITNEGGKRDYPYYWTSTSHVRFSSDTAGVYIAFGRALGLMQDPRTGRRTLMDVHGAGAQRSDVKAGDPDQLPQGRGPQGDIMRVTNFARCVCGGTADPQTSGPALETRSPQQGNRPGNRWGRPNMGPPTGGMGGPVNWGALFVQRLDRNGDGKVSRQEFDGPPDHFGVLDRDHDGFLSQDEAPGPVFRPGP